MRNGLAINAYHKVDPECMSILSSDPFWPLQNALHNKSRQYLALTLLTFPAFGSPAPRLLQLTRNIEPGFAQYLCEQTNKNSKSMNDQDGATITITFLLLLPWLGRIAVSAITIWQEHWQSHTTKAK
jgi:hypothetical protein